MLNNTKSLEGRLGSNQDTSDEYLECVVNYVDVFNYTCNGVADDSSSCRGILLPEIQINNSGEIRLPCCGDRILVRLTRGGDPVYEKHIIGVEGHKDGRPKYNFLEAPRNHQHVRVPSMPGDYHRYAPGGGFFQMLRGGITRLGVSPLCQFVLGKWENFIRVISQNWEFFSYGLNAYSTNKAGNITTRFSFFRRDSYGLTYQKNWSKRSDYDVLIDINGLEFLAGLVEPSAFVRQNRLKIFIGPDGTVRINQGKLSETKLSRQEIILGPEGKFFEHSQWNESNQRMYYEHIETTATGNCKKLVEMEGSYELNVKGNISICASQRAQFSGMQTTIGSMGNAIQPAPSVVTVEGSYFVCNTPVYSFTGVKQ